MKVKKEGDEKITEIIRKKLKLGEETEIVGFISMIIVKGLKIKRSLTILIRYIITWIIILIIIIMLIIMLIIIILIMLVID
jgi:hypothetical protein